MVKGWIGQGGHLVIVSLFFLPPFPVQQAGIHPELTAVLSARPRGREDNYLRQQSDPVYLGEHVRCQNKAALSSDPSIFQQRYETSN